MSQSVAAIQPRGSLRPGFTRNLHALGSAAVLKSACEGVSGQERLGGGGGGGEVALGLVLKRGETCFYKSRWALRGLRDSQDGGREVNFQKSLMGAADAAPRRPPTPAATLAAPHSPTPIM